MKSQVSKWGGHDSIYPCSYMLNIYRIKLFFRYLIPQTEGFGFNTWKNLIVGNETWQESGLFPRVTLCDFEVDFRPNFFKFLGP